MTAINGLTLPFRCDQRVEWVACGGAQAGRLITWRGPTEKGVYVLTVIAAAAGQHGRLVTLHTPGPFAAPAQIREVSRHA
jgi:hypothetical protein